jgi:hypothetical protein
MLVGGVARQPLSIAFGFSGPSCSFVFYRLFSPTIARRVRLKAGGYKVEQMKAKAPLQTLALYDAEVVKDAKLPTIGSRPVSSVVQTVAN